MDHKKYKHAFQQIRFSEHLEEDILSNLEKRGFLYCITPCINDFQS